MNATEHLLQKLQEECNEVGKEASKCNLFGLDDVNAVLRITKPDHPTNRFLLAAEVDDLAGTIELLREEGILPPANPERIARKKEKIKQWMGYARLVGTLFDKPELAGAAIKIMRSMGRLYELWEQQDNELADARSRIPAEDRDADREAQETARIEVSRRNQIAEAMISALKQAGIENGKMPDGL